MMDINILDFLRNANNLNGVHLNDSVDKVFELRGDPLEIIGDKACGFLHYGNGIRFGYFGTEIDELAIIFYGGKSITYIVDCEHIRIINEKSTINEILLFLNFSNIEWKSNDEKNVNVFSVKLNNNIYILFDLLTGRLTKISISR